ncbi:MAG: type II toxin-antitoxin system VapC family toxin [Verrucomicrobiaceae bacterium]|nr:type II toxin-antitoxin system VapC family toxin [Verrucomicrobiaceae bacterium]
MFILDTNHLRELTDGTMLGEKLRRKILASETGVVTSIVSADESLRGWLAYIAKANSPEREAEAYFRLNETIDILGDLIRLPYDLEAAARFTAFRKAGMQIGSKDLKIACIALEHDAVVLTRNNRDFIKVPGLKIENWLD